MAPDGLAKDFRKYVRILDRLMIYMTYARSVNWRTSEPCGGRTLGLPRKLRSEEDAEDFEQELVDQYALALAGSGLTTGTWPANGR